MSEQLIETHGKIEGQPTTLEQIWGFNENARYGTLEEEEYTKQVHEMSRSELEAHARRVGVVIVESSARLQDKLIREFRSYVSLLRKPQTVKKPESFPSDDVRKILAEGR
jgi:hypothetical protein